MLKNGKLEIKISLIPEGIGIQHQKTGILVKQGNSNELAMSISGILKRKKFLNKIIRFALKDVKKRFFLLKISKQTITFYETIS